MIRLDLLLHQQHPHLSRTHIQNIIEQGKVLVAGKSITKPGTKVAEDAEITVDLEEPKFVGRAGFKLEAALDAFKIDVTDKVVLDAGISTGGFTDCLLQRGARKVYGIDVGHGQVHEKIAKDSRVVLLEKTNLRSLESLPELVDLATLDLSFISVLKVMSAVKKLLKPGGRVIVLIKPQFEAQRHDIGKGGIVRDERVHQKVIEKIKMGMAELGFEVQGVIDSPITGSDGNKEFLAVVGSI